jgi:hypothetical protein
MTTVKRPEAVEMARFLMLIEGWAHPIPTLKAFEVSGLEAVVYSKVLLQILSLEQWEDQ